MMSCDERVPGKRTRLRERPPADHDLRLITIPVPALADGREEDPGVDIDREERFLQLFVANERRIYAFILTLVPFWSDADDLLQETSAVLWRKLDEFHPGSDFVAWALQIARFEVLNYRRRQTRDRGLFSDQTTEALADQAAAWEGAGDDRRDALEMCLMKLNERDRELIRLRYEPGSTTQEVADRVGRSIKAVYKALNRIHEQLLLCIRKRLAAKGRS
jgi:RNA polymerase sigma-70 factor (ECF subfamily)